MSCRCQLIFCMVVRLFVLTVNTSIRNTLMRYIGFCVIAFGFRLFIKMSPPRIYIFSIFTLIISIFSQPITIINPRHSVIAFTSHERSFKS